MDSITENVVLSSEFLMDPILLTQNYSQKLTLEIYNLKLSERNFPLVGATFLFNKTLVLRSL